MKFLKLEKPIKTKVVSYEKGADGKNVTDADGNKKVSLERVVEIKGVEVPQYESLEEATQAAGSVEQLLKSINKWTKDEAVAPVRLVGSQFSTDDSDDVIASKGREVARSVNPFEDRRGGGNAENKRLADQLRSIQEAAKSGMSDAELIALIRGGAV